MEIQESTPCAHRWKNYCLIILNHIGKNWRNVSRHTCLRCLFKRKKHRLSDFIDRQPVFFEMILLGTYAAKSL